MKPGNYPNEYILLFSLGTALIDGSELSNNELRERINKLIIGHSTLMKLKIIQGDGSWIDLSLCRNLTHFTLELDEGMNSRKYEQLLSLLDFNLNLEILNFVK
uniref:Uncharacterized protein n=1 Tax=Romanomermis culicivorax TaxID=13658 RepID=A0A915IP79_ROMCU